MLQNLSSHKNIYVAVFECPAECTLKDFGKPLNTCMKYKNEPATILEANNQQAIENVKCFYILQHMVETDY